MLIVKFKMAFQRSIGGAYASSVMQCRFSDRLYVWLSNDHYHRDKPIGDRSDVNPKNSPWLAAMGFHTPLGEI